MQAREGRVWPSGQESGADIRGGKHQAGRVSLHCSHQTEHQQADLSQSESWVLFIVQLSHLIMTQLKAPKGSLQGAYFVYQYLELCLFTVRKLASATS